MATNKTTIDEFVTRIKNNTPLVYEKGKTEGVDEGLDTAITIHEEFLADKPKTHYDAFWDSVKETMDADSQWFYNFSGSAWNDFTFNPPFDLVVPYTSGLFFQSVITDLKGILDRNGVKLDFSKATRINSITEGSSITRIGVIDTRKCIALQNFLYNSRNLEYVEKIILKDDGTQIFNASSFALLPNLMHCVFEGVIGYTVSFDSCIKLNKASIESVVNALSTTTSGLTVTLSQTAIDNAFTTEEWEALETTKSNWTISLV